MYCIYCLSVNKQSYIRGSEFTVREFLIRPAIISVMPNIIDEPLYTLFISVIALIHLYMQEAINEDELQLILWDLLSQHFD